MESFAKELYGIVLQKGSAVIRLLVKSKIFIRIPRSCLAKERTYKSIGTARHMGIPRVAPEGLTAYNFGLNYADYTKKHRGNIADFLVLDYWLATRSMLANQKLSSNPNPYGN